MRRLVHAIGRLFTSRADHAPARAVQPARAAVERRTPFAVCMADEPPAWSEFDQHNLATFFRTESGLKLKMLFSYYEQGRNRTAVLSGDLTAAHRAAGFHEFAAWLEKLSANVPPQEDDPNPLSTGARELVERLAP